MESPTLRTFVEKVEGSLPLVAEWTPIRCDAPVGYATIPSKGGARAQALAGGRWTVQQRGDGTVAVCPVHSASQDGAEGQAQPSEAAGAEGQAPPSGAAGAAGRRVRQLGEAACRACPRPVSGCTRLSRAGPVPSADGWWDEEGFRRLARIHIFGGYQPERASPYGKNITFQDTLVSALAAVGPVLKFAGRHDNGLPYGSQETTEGQRFLAAFLNGRGRAAAATASRKPGFRVAWAQCLAEHGREGPATDAERARIEAAVKKVEARGDYTSGPAAEEDSLELVELFREVKRALDADGQLTGWTADQMQLCWEAGQVARRRVAAGMTRLSQGELKAVEDVLEAEPDIHLDLPAVKASARWGRTTGAPLDA